MTKQMLAALDLEIASEVEGDDWHSQGPLGIACLGWAEKMASDLSVKYDFWDGYPRLKKEQCVKIVRELMRLTADGRWCIVTVNGAAFDWRVLAEESGMKAECAELAMNHCDLTAMFLCKFGWPVGLAALADGAGTFKAHSAVLRDGREVEIAGAMAPKLWKNGEREAVLGYMRQDCIATVTTAAVVTESRVCGLRLKRWQTLSRHSPNWPGWCLSAQLARVPFMACPRYKLDECANCTFQHNQMDGGVRCQK